MFGGGGDYFGRVIAGLLRVRNMEMSAVWRAAPRPLPSRPSDFPVPDGRNRLTAAQSANSKSSNGGKHVQSIFRPHEWRSGAAWILRGAERTCGAIRRTARARPGEDHPRLPPRKMRTNTPCRAPPAAPLGMPTTCGRDARAVHPVDSEIRYTLAVTASHARGDTDLSRALHVTGIRH